MQSPTVMHTICDVSAQSDRAGGRVDYNGNGAAVALDSNKPAAFVAVIVAPVATSVVAGAACAVSAPSITVIARTEAPPRRARFKLLCREDPNIFYCLPVI